MGVEHYIKERHPASKKWDETREYMDTHIYGKPPRRIYINRRPLESENPFALQYRLDNWQPFTKEPFRLALSSFSEVADQLAIEIKDIDIDTSEYLLDYKINIGAKDYSIREYFTTYVLKQVEADPNSCIVFMPKHPTEDFIPSYQYELPDFDAITSERIDVDIMVIPSILIHYFSDQYLLFKGGKYEVYHKDGNKLEDYFWQLSKEETLLWIPEYKQKDGGGQELVYRPEIFYANDTVNPIHRVVGNNRVVETVTYEDGKFLDYRNQYEIEYHESSFSGAVSLMNLAIGIEADSKVIDTRYTYPEKVVLYQECDAQCTEHIDPEHPLYGRRVVRSANGDDCELCGKCGGTGSVKPDTTPLGSHVMQKDDLFDTSGNYIAPVQFIAPELEAAKYMNANWRDLYEEGCRALYVVRQNNTNQSGDSKAYDYKQKVTTTTSAVKNVYRLMKAAFNGVQELRGGEPTVTIELPIDFNVKDSLDVMMEIKDSQTASSDYKAELHSQLMITRFGNTPKNRKIIEFLETYDLLFGKSDEDIIRAKGALGEVFTSRDYVVHEKGFSILKRLSRSDDFMDKTMDSLKSDFDAEIEKITPSVSVAIA